MSQYCRYGPFNTLGMLVWGRDAFLNTLDHSGRKKHLFIMYSGCSLVSKGLSTIGENVSNPRKLWILVMGL